MIPHCPDCGVELDKITDNPADWYCPVCYVIWDQEDLDEEDD